MDRDKLVETLELLKPALADTPLVRVFECYQFDGKRISAYNDELAIVAPLETDHAFAVNGRILLGLLNNCRSEEVSLDPTIVNDEQVLHVKAGRSHFQLPYF